MKKIYRLSSKNIRSLQDVIVICLLAGLLLYGVSTDNPTNPMLYQCYAVAFWHGWSEFQKLGLSGQCGFILNPNKDLIAFSQNGILHAMQQWRLPSGLVQFVAAQKTPLREENSSSKEVRLINGKERGGIW